MAKHKVLSTKKLEPSLIQQAKERDIEIIEKEFISVKPILTQEKCDEVMPWVLSRQVNNVAFTSANGAEAVKQYLRQGATLSLPNWKVYCISGRTKNALHPFIKNENIVATAEYGKDLAQKIIEQKVKEIVFFCGNKRRDELPTILKEAGINVHEVIVYETVETPVVTADDIDAILFFSPSAVQSFFSVNQLKKNTVCFVIGQTTANSIADFTDNRIIVSESPGQEMMLASVYFYFQNTNWYE